MNRLKNRLSAAPHWGACVFLLVAAVAAATGASPGREDLPKLGGMIRVRDFTTSLKPNLDPAVASWVFATEQIFEGLVRLDNRLDLVPSLAEYWMVSEDRCRMTFILKRGVRFHHGREFDAQDVKYSFERLLRRETKSPYAGLLAGKIVGAEEFWDGKAAEVTGFRAPEKYVFEVSWKAPSVASLYLLSMSFCKILPRDKLIEEGAGFFDKPSGTGPFRFANWMRSPQLDIVGVHLDRFEQYHGRKAYLDHVEYSPYLTVDHFMSGDADIMPFLSDRMANSGCQAVVGVPYKESYLGFSCQIPPFDRSVVRRAVAAAINKDRLIEAAQAPDRVRRQASSYIPSGLPGFLPLEETSHFDSEQARRLLDELGYSGERRFPSLLLFVLKPRAEAPMRLAREIAAQLDAVGISVSIRTYTKADDLLDVRTPYLTFFTWLMDYPDAENIILPLFGQGTDGLQFLIHYSSPALDKLLEESAAEKSWTRRIELFHRMEKLLGQDMPAVPLFTEEERLAVQSYVRGVRMPPLGSSYLDAKDLWLDRRSPRP
ncbi:MAG: ABC transporter substrate-binding protein [Candidatus Aminicenantes bacterium]|nr:ABC transporter substrate-binding protein [Candidatus Aminicenantes bacterium]